MLISVVIPVFNRRDCVCRAVASALKIDDRLAEVLVVDDGSTDGSAEIVRETFASAVAQRKVIVQRFEKNAGATAAKNAGAFLASGEWIVFLDSDDVLLEKSIPSFITELDAASNQSIVFFRCVDSAQQLIGDAPLSAAQISTRRYLRDWRWGECLPVVRTGVFRQHPYDSSLRGFEGLTYARIMRALAGGATVAPVVARLYDTQRSDRISTSRGMLARSRLLSRGHWQLFVEFPRELGIEGCVRSIVKSAYYASLYCASLLGRAGARPR